jgi:cytochrome c peroxidase
MKHLALAFLSIAAIGCKKSETGGGGTAGSGSAVGSAAPTVRPSQQPLPPLPPLQLADDPKRADKVALGHALFFDKRLSANNDRACYSCHMNEDGGGGHDPLASGSGDKPLTRHAPVIWNVAYYQPQSGKGALYWDGRAPTLEANALAAWGGPNMAVGKDNLDKKAAEIAKLPEYAKLFAAAFPSTEIKGDQVANAIAEYERTLVCKDTAYDKYAGGDKSALSDQQQRGLDVFLGKGQCTTCHAPPFFSTAMNVDNGVYFNVGIGTQGVAEDKVDIGRMKVSNKPEDWAAFKPPSLRNVTKTAPYFHDGSVAKLDEAVKLMAAGGIANKNRSPALADRALNDTERGDLVAFLGALDCPGKLEEPAAPAKAPDKTPAKSGKKPAKAPAKKKGK